MLLSSMSQFSSSDGMVWVVALLQLTEAVYDAEGSSRVEPSNNDYLGWEQLWWFSNRIGPKRLGLE